MHRCVWGEMVGSSPDVMIVGEAPGFHEDQTKRPFVGPSGKLLRGALESAGVAEYYITNVIKCRPPKNQLPDTEKRLKAVLEACVPYLHEEIRALQPKFILALGNTPLRALTGQRGITKHRGAQTTADFGYGPVTVFPAYHPAFILRGPGLEKVFRLDLGTFANLVKGINGESFWSLMKVEVVRNRYGLELLEMSHKKALDQDRIQVYDIESMGLLLDGKYIPATECPPEEGTIPWLGIGYHHKNGANVNYVIPWEHPRVPTVWREYVTSLAKRLLEDPAVRRVAQHGKFDDRWLYSRGIYPARTFDTYNAAFLLDENIPHGLETIAKLEVGAPLWGEGFEYDKLDTLPFATVADYLGKDLYATGQCYYPLREKLLINQGLARVFKHIVMPGDLMLCRVQQRGLWVHEDELTATTAVFKDKRSGSLSDLHKTAGQEINWNSPEQKAKLLFEERGLPVIKRSKKTGKPSTDKDVMAILEERTDDPLIPELRKYQKIEMLCRFLKRWGEKLERAKAVRGTPRIYTELNISKVTTGRLSASDPDGTGDNLQQVPIRGEGAELRAVFGAPPGRRLIEADYSQAELRWAAIFGPERSMTRIFLEGRDIHTATAARILRKAEDEVSKEDRRKAKAVNFGFIYGMSAKKFVKYALTEYGVSVTLGEAEGVRQAYFRLFSDLPHYYRRIEKELRSTGQVVSPLGRIRRLPEINSPDEFTQEEAIRKAINFPIQSVASDMTLMAALHIDKLMPEEVGGIVCLVHDSILIECDEKYATEVACLCKQTMVAEIPQQLDEKFGIKLHIPMEAEVSIGTQWGKGTEWKGE